VYLNDQAGFLAAAETLGSLTTIHFETLPDGSPLGDADRLSGNEFSALGVTFESPDPPGYELKICGPATWHGSNSLSPGACPNEVGDAAFDSLVVRFDPPVLAAGFQPVESFDWVGESVTFVYASGAVVVLGHLPSSWVGVVSPDLPIAEIHVVESPDDSDDVAYDNFVFVR
jgi:hypothetical protein